MQNIAAALNTELLKGNLERYGKESSAACNRRGVGGRCIKSLVVDERVP